MKILFIGDIVGEPGRRAVKDLVPGLRRRHGVDVVIANGENAAGGSGITPKTAEEIFRNFSPDEQAIVRRIMLRLTKLGEGTEDTRRSARIDEIATTSSEASAVERVIKAMVDARLLTVT